MVYPLILQTADGRLNGFNLGCCDWHTYRYGHNRGDGLLADVYHDRNFCYGKSFYLASIRYAVTGFRVYANLTKFFNVRPGIVRAFFFYCVTFSEYIKLYGYAPGITHVIHRCNENAAEDRLLRSGEFGSDIRSKKFRDLRPVKYHLLERCVKSCYTPCVWTKAAGGKGSQTREWEYRRIWSSVLSVVVDPCDGAEMVRYE